MVTNFNPATILPTRRNCAVGKPAAGRELLTPACFHAHAESRTIARMSPIIEIDGLCKSYEDGFQALKNVTLNIRKGEIFALLGPNGAGKTTLINIVCGIVRPTGGSVTVDGHDIVDQFRHTRAMIGLVPQELPTETFETVWDTVSFSRGLFGKSANPEHIESVLRVVF